MPAATAAKTNTAEKIIFLPGALGQANFWHQAGNRIQFPAEKIYLGYPGFGQHPATADVTDFDSLLAWSIAHLDRPSHLIAHSMGGLIALLAAIKQPALVKSLVLVATSGGVDLSAFETSNWRLDYHQQHPELPEWFSLASFDLSQQLADLNLPVLIVSGELDPIAPPELGHYFQQTMPKAEFKLMPQAQHDLAQSHDLQLALWIDLFLSKQQQ